MAVQHLLPTAALFEFLALPQEQGAFLLTLGSSRWTVNQWRRKGGTRRALRVLRRSGDRADPRCVLQVSVSLANEFDGIAIWAGHKGNNGDARIHGTRLADNLAPHLFDSITGGIDIINFDGEMAITIAEIVLIHTPVIGEFYDGVVPFVAVANEGQGKFSFGILLPAQEFHTEDLSVEVDRPVEVAGTEHGV
jgi:hypothetical protein